jgi:hypothetical protein
MDGKGAWRDNVFVERLWRTIIWRSCSTGSAVGFWHGGCRVESVGETVGLGLSGSAKYWSEWQDLNLRPPRPERGALPD